MESQEQQKEEEEGQAQGQQQELEQEEVEGQAQDQQQELELEQGQEQGEGQERRPHSFFGDWVSQLLEGAEGTLGHLAKKFVEQLHGPEQGGLGPAPDSAAGTPVRHERVR